MKVDNWNDVSSGGSWTGSGWTCAGCGDFVPWVSDLAHVCRGVPVVPTTSTTPMPTLGGGDSFRTALERIVAALGPDEVCGCEDCVKAEGLRAEAVEALRLARAALGLEKPAKFVKKPHRSE